MLWEFWWLPERLECELEVGWEFEEGWVDWDLSLATPRTNPFAMRCSLICWFEQKVVKERDKLGREGMKEKESEKRVGGMSQ